MGSVPVVDARGYFSVVRYVSNLARDEAKNVAVILATDSGFHAVRAVPPSRLAMRLRDQGVIDALLVSVAERLRGLDRVGLAELDVWHRSVSHSLQLSEPRQVAVSGDPARVLEDLYRALVASNGYPRKSLGKAQVLDKVVQSFRSRGATVRRAAYLGDFVFDAIVEPPDKQPTAIGVLSFATIGRDWTHVERDAGHFLFAAGRVVADSLCVVQPPLLGHTEGASQSYARVNRWLMDESIRTIGPAEVGDFARVSAPGDNQLSLVMAD